MWTIGRMDASRYPETANLRALFWKELQDTQDALHFRFGPRRHLIGRKSGRLKGFGFNGTLTVSR